MNDPFPKLLPVLPRRVLLLGSGALQIGQAGEFDYSGSQALKALREEGIHTIVINPNIATVQTSSGLADTVYYLPVAPSFVEEVIKKEKPDAILLGFGGQSALNCGLELSDSGVLARYGVRVLGSAVETIRACEDRQIFADKMRQIDLPLCRGRTITSFKQAQLVADELGFPLMLRAGFSLGGRGSAIVHDHKALKDAVERALSGVPQVLLEECLSGWKEFEYELVRDEKDNCLAVCNMENIDPMGVHTGESIVVAPSQTLSDAEHQLLRDAALRAIRHLGIVGECNMQFALDLHSACYKVIEINPRLSRSSALASKATGYPLAYIAAKLALGYALPQLRNSITGTTTACFEPALDYIVCKIPRWDVQKFVGADSRIGTEMKSVGEVMAIGRSFAEVLQKALRMLEVGADGFDPVQIGERDPQKLLDELAIPSVHRIFLLAAAFAAGVTVEQIAVCTGIDSFFLHKMAAIIALRQKLSAMAGPWSSEVWAQAKRAGFSDATLARLRHSTMECMRAERLQAGIRPRLRQVDTLAAEYPTETNYLYFTYAADSDDVTPAPGPKLLLLGSGCYRIGSSVEFDWGCVSAARTARQLGYNVVLLNCNPETVSTDYDLCARLIFDEVSLETVRDVWDFENGAETGLCGVLLALGGQTPNRLAVPLEQAGISILGTSAKSIDQAEDRAKFSALCDALEIDQPSWTAAADFADLEAAVHKLGGFPVLVRPSYVLSGAAMRVAHSASELLRYVATATQVSPQHPVVISKFLRRAREIEFDAVASAGQIVLWAICEHLEDAGVHSGDATLVLPPQRLGADIIVRVRHIGAELARRLCVSGPFNVQILVQGDEVKVIECNLRASRSFPFVSQALGQDFIHVATQVMLNISPRIAELRDPLQRNYVAVKAPMFSFRRLSGADPLLGVEMAATGEAAGFGTSLEEALAKALLATGFRFPRRGVLLSLGPESDKSLFTEEARHLQALGLQLFATAGTAAVLQSEGICCQVLDIGEAGDGGQDASEFLNRLRAGDIDLVINIPRRYDSQGRPDGYRIRRAAIDAEIPLLTDLELARAVIQMLRRIERPRESLAIEPWHFYLGIRGCCGLAQ